jgi:hypothetical protein
MLFNSNERPLSVYDICKSLEVSQSKARYGILKRLTEYGYIIQESEGYRLKYYAHEVFTECIAVEAKISNWKRGLYQAYRYKWFANRSYLALDENYIAPAMKNLNQFQELNIGLISVGADKLDIIVDAKPETPKSHDSFMIASEEIFSSHLETPVPVQ